jgi:sugar lactone lactonase YvrE
VADHEKRGGLVIEAKLKFPLLCDLGEGSLWDEREQVLYWIDIAQNKVYRYNPQNGSNLAYDVGENVGTVVVTINDKLLLALRSGFAWLDPNTGRVTHLGDPEADKPHTRFNDGKCDPKGRFWAGTMVENSQTGDGALYCLDTDLTITRKLTGVTCSNGLVWSRDQRRFYYIDTPTLQINCFEFDLETGSLGARRVVAALPRETGAPDGMTIDSEDGLWVALFGGGRVIRIAPLSGQVDCEVEVASPNVTSCAFGGPELNELYITTARVGLSDERRREYPLAGSLFSARLPFRGVPAYRFAREL